MTSSPRKAREQPFLNDPAAYPEFSLLIKRQSFQHSLRYQLHQYRTAALVGLVALSIAAAGGVMPSLSVSGDADWVAYLAKGMNVTLFERHFEGIVSALGCITASSLVALLAYPIYQMATPSAKKDAATVASTAGWHRLSVPARVLAAAAPSVAVWGAAVHAAGVFRWGVASGLIVGLQCASLTLKTISFVQQARPTTFHAFAADPAIPAPGGGGGGGVDGADGLPSPPAPAPAPALTFEEFAFFLLAAPSLVCEPQLLVSSARRPRRAAAAASEFLHAGLAYLAVHAACSALFAPALRVLATALHSEGGGSQTGWGDAELWSELLRVECSGWWLHGLRGGGEGGSFGNEAAGKVFGDHGLLTVVVAACLGMFVFSPMMHYLMFYAFFHAICHGCAELWGYPDRNIYGPWWLVVDDARDYFRLWSAPVHKWLSRTVQRPMIEAGRREAARCRLRHQQQQQQQQQQEAAVSIPSAGGRSGGSRGGAGDGGVAARWWVASVVCAFLVSGMIHEAVAFVAMRRVFWPFNTLFLVVSASLTPFWDSLFPVVVAADDDDAPAAACAALETSGDGGGEAAVVVTKEAKGAVREPPRAGNGTAAPSTATGRSPVTGHPADVAPTTAAVLHLSGGSAQEGGGPARSGAKRERTRPEIGSWRGWAAVVFYAATSVPLTLVVDYLVWQYWRHTHLVQ